MKKLVLMLAIVFAFGVTYAGNLAAENQKAATEQVPSQDDKDKKEAKADSTKAKADKKSCSEKKACCSDKK